MSEGIVSASTKVAFSIMLLISAFLGYYLYYYNSLIPKPETFKTLFWYMFDSQGKYLLTILLNFFSFPAFILLESIFLVFAVRHFNGVGLFGNESNYDFAPVFKI
ncbi:hypothetical protein M5W83_27260 [Paenibacillus thiaminolyticus]|uniref:Uncharacterized protein n=1 Tax=Paenibacillus thiaminolyticus TaxID=49283 RepID=A0AAP9DWB3_PANTH|nr:hypothetical protein [Paenibacillus thiaminolyticus]MCY9538364.1 hypothetical protein [Paenibacillus thiaminolyticus]MCY9602729.1 hypothetical protein [Paenibacillus thiaminolyticus]MCY9610849.1 hypothetical protein [Paenibacillus thiaminolyticus]MCY9616097.1 hypothetical protein [Paenibacillus thiaminolyticus]MCY9621380.1 hypothetical protein [Paenibacillus thiaminolyticus]